MTITANLIMLSFSQTNHYKLSVSLDHLNTACFLIGRLQLGLQHLLKNGKIKDAFEFDFQFICSFPQPSSACS